MILTVCLNPAVDRTVSVEMLTVDGVNRVVTSRRDPGGKGINVAKMVAALGGDTLSVGVVGGSTGEYIKQQLDELGVRHDYVVRDRATRTNLKIMDVCRRTMTELNEPGAPVTEEELAQVWQKIEAAVKPGDIVALSGANPPGMAEDVLAKWITALREKGITTALDTVGAPMRLGIAAKPTLIKPNREELSEFFGEPLHYQRDILAAAREILERGVERVVVSMGGEGALFVTADEVLFGHGLPVKVGSTVGSGDAMLAALLYGMQRGDSWELTAKRSLAAGTANAMTEGSQTPEIEKIRELVDRIVIERLT
ncbi:MAG: 1-phosphofructokinase [Oscillospiraceae bacterium]|nr:1-phosphofructokinase [Oscillospiraceae bacterium]